MEQEDLTYRYEVDDADNLTKVYLQNGSDPESLVETFGHDADGNMIMRANVVTGEVTDYEWNDSDRLIRVSTSIGGAPTSRLAESNRYDSSGIRKRKLDRNGNSALEYTADIITAASKAGTSSSQTPTISYVMGHQILGAEVNGNFQFFLTDALGTVRDVIDDSGDVVQSYEFDEHGIPMPGSGAASGTFSPKTYQGALSVNDDRNDSGLYLMGHRHYAPELGRFISRDPIGFEGGLHLFNGAGASPVTLTDPYGLWTIDWTSVAIGAGRAMKGFAVGACIGFGVAMVAPAGVAVAFGVVGGAYFAAGLMETGRAIATGTDSDGNALSDAQRSELLGEALVQGASLGYSKLPHMGRGRENVPGYFKEGPCGRWKYEMGKNTQSDSSWRRGEPWKLSNWNPAKAFSPKMQGTGPTPGARISAEMGRNASVGDAPLDAGASLMQGLRMRPGNL